MFASTPLCSLSKVQFCVKIPPIRNTGGKFKPLYQLNNQNDYNTFGIRKKITVLFSRKKTKKKKKKKKKRKERKKKRKKKNERKNIKIL